MSMCCRSWLPYIFKQDNCCIIKEIDPVKLIWAKNSINSEKCKMQNSGEGLPFEVEQTLNVF